jgi:hypothetical protein
MPKLAEAFGERVSVKEPHSLDALLYSVPFVHRAYQLTYPSAPELFLPLRENCFVRKNGSKETWLAARVPSRYLSAHFARVLPRGWERDLGSNDKVVVRRKTRFDWNGRQLRDSMPRLVSYHARTRRDVVPIYSNWTRWYLRRNVADPRAIRRAPVILAFAAMHRLSELTRYFPQRLARHFDGRQNWLLAEFLSMAPAQFVFAIASELTGREFIRPDSYSTGPSRNG